MPSLLYDENVTITLSIDGKETITKVVTFEESITIIEFIENIGITDDQLKDIITKVGYYYGISYKELSKPRTNKLKGTQRLTRPKACIYYRLYVKHHLTQKFIGEIFGMTRTGIRDAIRVLRKNGLNEYNDIIF